MDKNGHKIAMGLDVSTACIGVCILLEDGSDYGKIIELTHINPEIKKERGKEKIKGVEELFMKKKIFEEFISRFKDIGIDKVIIEEPLLRSNNVNTVSVLLRFNGMISECIYNVFGIVPEYISSYEAREFSFPELMAVRKYDKKEELYPPKKIENSIIGKKFVLFGGYPWSIDKKTVIQGKVAALFPDIPWLYDKKGNLKKQNFDACDSYVACLGFLNKEKYGEPTFEVENVVKNEEEQSITYDVKYWNRVENRKTYLT